MSVNRLADEVAAKTNKADKGKSKVSVIGWTVLAVVVIEIAIYVLAGLGQYVNHEQTIKAAASAAALQTKEANATALKGCLAQAAAPVIIAKEDGGPAQQAAAASEYNTAVKQCDAEY